MKFYFLKLAQEKLLKEISELDVYNENLARNPNLPYHICLKLIKYKPIALLKYLNTNKQANNKFKLLQKFANKFYKGILIYDN